MVERIPNCSCGSTAGCQLCNPKAMGGVVIADGVMPTVKDDLDRIERTLKAARRVAGTMRRGGLQTLHDDLTWALEALERVREAWRERPAQVRMWDG